jgi:hypothetical protein
MTEQHPIMPPDELVQQWRNSKILLKDALMVAAQWGADQELEACCNWVAVESIAAATELRSWRRPKPPSLKEQALEIFQRLSKDGFPCNYQEDSDWDTIRRALESIND